jgi:hypothetical protein
MNSPRNITMVLLLVAAAGAASAQTTTSSGQAQPAQTAAVGTTGAPVAAGRSTARSTSRQPTRVAQQRNHNHDSMTGGGPN